MASNKRGAWSRFWALSKLFFTSEARWTGLGLLILLIVLLLSLSGLNVVNSYVNRDFMTALAQRQAHRFYVFAAVYVGVFLGSTVVAAFYRYTELRLGLRWRQWLTTYFIDRYLANQIYHRINARQDIDNPDQRISQDIQTFTTTSVSFLLMILNSLITILAFAGVLLSISPWLGLAAILYPAVGTGVIFLLGRRLIGLNNLQLKKEADLRYELVHVREHAESIAMVRGERREKTRLLDRLKEVVQNYLAIITVIRNVKFFTEGYNYMIQLLPVLIVAPLYLHEQVEFGVVTQAAMAFAQMFNAFSLIVEEFQSLSEFAAVVGRLGTLWEAVEGRPAPTPVPAEPRVEVVVDGGRVASEGLTLRTPHQGRPLIRDLRLHVAPGQRLLVAGPSGAGKTALFRAIAGTWWSGEGRILRPAPDQVRFLPQRPYMVRGTLRDQFLCGSERDDVPEDRLLAVLRDVGLEDLPERVGGLDVEEDWTHLLSVGEQQRLAFARLLLANPPFAFLDHAVSALAEPERKHLYDLLAKSSITYFSVEDDPELRGYHDAVLKLGRDGKWKLDPIPQPAA